MIDVHYWPTPNGWKVTIFCEEAGVPYRVVPVNIGKGEQFHPDFLAISPNNRMPAIVDPDGPDGKPISVFESGAILVYLAEKHGTFLSKDARERVQTIEWLMFQMANVGPMFGQASHFLNYAPEPIPYAIDRYTNEARRLCRVLDERLGEREFLAGEYSIADMANFAWVHALRKRIELDDTPNLARWCETIRARPAVEKGLAVLRDDSARQGPISEEARSILFGERQQARR